MNQKDIVIYKNKENSIELKVNLKGDTIWLDQKSIAKLFEVKRPAITKHVNNIFEDGELKEKTVCSILEHTASDGKTYKTKFYNLDMIISIGYRVNSSRATQFRIWATNVLREYITQGYILNQKRLEQDSKKWCLLQTQMENLKKVLDSRELSSLESNALIKVVTDYTKALNLIESVDRNSIPIPMNRKVCKIRNLNYENLLKDIKKIKEDLKYGEFFSIDSNHYLRSILKSIEQTFDKECLYNCVESRAANLLYLIIKDHPFIDGNKRIGSFTFLKYLDLNDLLYKEDGSKRIEQNTLVAIALLLAQSNPKDKNMMIDLVTYLIRIN